MSMKRASFIKLKVPDKCCPKIRWLFEEMNHQQCSIKSLAERSGVHYTAISQWRYRAGPTLQNYEACVNALGWDLPAPRRIRDEAD